jgi:hypothetical protein
VLSTPLPPSRKIRHLELLDRAKGLVDLREEVARRRLAAALARGREVRPKDGVVDVAAAVEAGAQTQG